MTKRSCKIDLPVVSRDPWPDGTVVTFHAIPLPFRRKPQVSARLPFKTLSVPLSRVVASQHSVSDVGLCKRIGGLPLVYREHDGTFTVSDGHHRIVRALLRGRRRLRMRVVDVP